MKSNCQLTVNKCGHSLHMHGYHETLCGFRPQVSPPVASGARPRYLLLGYRKHVNDLCSTISEVCHIWAYHNVYM